MAKGRSRTERTKIGPLRPAAVNRSADCEMSFRPPACTFPHAPPSSPFLLPCLTPPRVQAAVRLSLHASVENSFSTTIAECYVGHRRSGGDAQCQQHTNEALHGAERERTPASRSSVGGTTRSDFASSTRSSMTRRCPKNVPPSSQCSRHAYPHPPPPPTPTHPTVPEPALPPGTSPACA